MDMMVSVDVWFASPLAGTRAVTEAGEAKFQEMVKIRITNP
jgi:hypothetical protein